MLIHLENISKIYKEKDFTVNALDKVNLDIEEGEMVAVMGTSGSGKSTLLNILGCLDKPSNGKYYLNNHEISTYSEKQMARLRNEIFGFVLQDFALIERYTVAKNVELPLYYSKGCKSFCKNNNKNRDSSENKNFIKCKYPEYLKERKQHVEEILAQVGILEKKNQLALRLSGGQRQRTAIARALVNDAKILLCDEPTGALDRKTGEDIVNIFKELNRRNKTVVIVTHDLNVAKACSRVVMITDGHVEDVESVEKI